MSKRTILIAVFFGLPVLAVIGVAWLVSYWSDWRAGLAILTVVVVLLAGHMIKDAL